MNSYTDYRMSLSKIPKDWSICRYKDWYQSKKEIIGDRVMEFERLALTLKGVIKRSKDDDNGLQPKDFDTYQILRKNDMVFKMIDLQNINTSRVGITKWDGLVSPAYLRFTPKYSDPGFMYYYFTSLYYNNVFNNIAGDGVRSALNSTDIGNIICPFPPLDQQKKIVEIMEIKIAQINKLINNQEKQIDNLNLYKQAIITKAVTMGLKSNTKSKDSGVYWIGNMPSSWSLRKFSSFTKVISKGATPTEMSLFEDELHTVRFIKGENIVNGMLDLNSSQFISEENDRILARSRLKVHDILFVIAGSIGKCAIVEELDKPTNINQAICFSRLKDEDLKYRYYLKYYLMSDQTKIYASLKTVVSSMPNLGMEDLGRLIIPYPSDDHEVEEIVNFLDKKTSDIDKLIRIKTQKIDRINEYKKAIIYEYVTGKAIAS